MGTKIFGRGLRPEVGLSVREEGAELVAGADEEVGLVVHVDDEGDGLEQHRVLRVGVLDLLGLGGLLRLVQNPLQTLQEPRSVRWVLSKRPPVHSHTITCRSSL